MSKKYTEYDERMKKYELVSRTRLMPRTPVIIRIDGKAFHTFTRGFKTPFDDVLRESMHDTMKYLCENIQGCVLGYTQSDEITLVLVDYKRLSSNAWFDYEVQKMCSVAASMATMSFNKSFAKHFDEWGEANLPDWDLGGTNEQVDEGLLKLCQVYHKAETKGAMFDARAFNIPKEEVCNNLYWRQQDAARNSIQMVGHTYFPDNELHGKSCAEIQDMLMTQKGINWNDYPTYLKRGSCCIKVDHILPDRKEGIIPFSEFVCRSSWEIDKEIPQFKGDGRQYVESLIQPEEQF